ncbi:MAG TPA: undecaprenyl-diphosphate phosphatase [Methanomicrobia archaeon]|nr:undecaprenyl-diphosphate phosphatase [Methanomicrobia archaeon]
MDAYQSVLLGVLQGVTEWLPISSQGQTVLVMLQFLRLEPAAALSMAIFLHTGTMLAVLLRFRADFRSMLAALFRIRADRGSLRGDPRSQLLLRHIVVATGATAVTALPLLYFVARMIESVEHATLLIGCLLILTGILLGLQRRARTSYRRFDELTVTDMVLAGLVQGFSILPGISRSGTTITILLMRGITQELALRLSFLMSVPAVLGALILFELGQVPAVSLRSAALMVLSSLLAGYLTMDLLLRFAARVNFASFCIVLGALTIVLTQLPQLGYFIY